jgi:VIT1/CCC1 family predicted Fe2+/Mn2+ transporter
MGSHVNVLVAVGAAMPLLITVIAPHVILIPAVAAASLAFLAVLGGRLAAHARGAGLWAGALRVTFWGALAMAVTAGVGALFGTVAG